MLTIRRYQPSDRSDVIALHYRSLPGTGANPGEGPWDDDLTKIEEVYLQSGGEFLVGVLDEQLIAMGAIKRKTDTLAEIKRMRVHPLHQRKGFGQQMLHALEQRALELGYHSICLDTTTIQAAAKHLYRKNGYAETKRTMMNNLEFIYFEKHL
ncbi:GNAT family N-acetyltransferase [Laceyella putida]|uniref:GNAT family N-acetyltransferase n=1 Tax=Laceyella putida TaxID=110101 RepID=A0ABW2RNB3_9BACL